MKLAFRKQGTAPKNLNLLKAEDIQTAAQLLSQGYTKSALLVSKAAKN